MKRHRTVLLVTLLPILAAVRPGFTQDDFAATLPAGVNLVWDFNKADREQSPTRERICIDGLWRWQPARTSVDQVPTKNWGYFKLPGCLPGITDYMQKDFQTVHAHPSWKDERPGSISAAWYERTITVPQEWAGRRVALSAEYLNSYAAVFVDGVRRGEIRFPGGELDLTAHLRPGGTNVLSLLVVAMPLKGVLLSYTDSNSAREVKGKVERRGLCGDVFLVSTPAGPRIGDVKVDTSVRESKITFDATLQELTADGQYSLRGRITRAGGTVREFTSRTFSGSDLDRGRIAFSEQWKPDALWDIHTPTNQFDVALSLVAADGRVLDTSFRTSFGFREFWIEGRDFYLNGSRIFLCAVPLDNAQVGAALATYDGARESLERLKSIGINFVYAHNYGCEPGSHLSFEEILRAADDVGMLVALSQPHFSHYEWKSAEADRTNGYARHAEFYVRAARNHPSVVAYSMSHNATGYEQDMNPDMIDGIQDPRDQWSSRNAALALRAEAIVKRFDSSRVVYHHASGNLGSMHVINFYPNFVPVQELSDWFEHWATHGVKPVFTCEYGAPFTWDWTMYRGWYQGKREWGSAVVPWEFCLAEWNAQFLGDRAFQISKAEAANLRWEAKQFRAGKVWHRWDYPHPVGSPVFEEQYPVFAMYLEDNWRAFRTWGVSGISPWEHEHFWRLRDGVDKRRREFKVDWDHLQRPGFSPDYVDKTYERWDLAFERADWIPTAAARALLRNNGPLLAYLGGKPGQFTSKDHVFFVGETVEKQLIVINNSRETVTCESDWSLGLPQAIAGSRCFAVATGHQERLPLQFTLPATLAAGQYELNARVRFSNGETQTDAFVIHVVPRPRAPRMRGRIALFDPKGETGGLLKELGVRFKAVAASADLAAFDTLIVGKAALTTEGAAPDITRVRDGLKVVIFEQTADVLERRFGFRVAEYGLRRVFARVPDHPALAGIAAEHWRDWRGEATILPPRLDYTLRPRYGPTVNWCDIPVPRLWRCGNRGNVASVLIEKPARGDFLPILDGGYGLQYAPLLEYREGRGLILFCQMDVTGRTESEPVAGTLTRNILQHVSDWRPAAARTAVYVGEPEGRRHLESAGITVGNYDGGRLTPNRVLVVSPGGGRELTQNKAAIAEWLKAGGNLLALGFDQQNAEALLPTPVTFTKAEHISAFFELNGIDSAFKGVGPADLHNRDPRELSLITSGATPLGNGVLATTAHRNIVFCQLVPWQFDPTKQSNLKRTYRRVSFVVTRLLANLGVASTTPMLARANTPVDPAKSEKRWLDGLYLDQPEEWDDPYRFFRW
ncbi:MAG TPA: glycoside hydrolase family 2 TIM barrel-domain containing protein [Verrucomicrobiae bacterium]|nr:glycoside hydrolase family 2 TIM barrel-domain containing protein [Verrucomicrobiae bacterium]